MEYKIFYPGVKAVNKNATSFTLISIKRFQKISRFQEILRITSSFHA